MSAVLPAHQLRDAMQRSRRRMPDGTRMRRFRWGPIDSGVITWPAVLITTKGLHAVGHESRWTVPHFPEDRTGFAYWLAHAVRQDVWRRAQKVPGLLPVVRVRRGKNDEGTPAVAVLAGAFLPSERGAPALDAMLADLFQPARMAHWTDWARRKTRDPLGTPDAAAPPQQARDDA